MELVHALSMCCEKHTNLLCKNNEQKPVGLALLLSRCHNWVDTNMIRVNDLSKRLDEQLFNASEFRIWKKRNIFQTEVKKGIGPFI